MVTAKRDCTPPKVDGTTVTQPSAEIIDGSMMLDGMLESVGVRRRGGDSA